MAENVFIFGAGASVDGGTPLMNNFVEKAIDLSHTFREEDPGFYQSVEKLLSLRSNLRSAQINSQLELDNIEDIYGALEMANYFSSKGNFFGESIQDLRRSLLEAVSKTIEYSSKFFVPFDSTDGVLFQGIFTKAQYPRFLDFLYRTSIDLESCTFMTFNYDLFLDTSITFNNLNYFKYPPRNDGQPRDLKISTRSLNYCIDDYREGIKLLKLHGSINWGICPNCKKVIVYPIEEQYAGYSGDELSQQPPNSRLSFRTRNAQLHYSEEIFGDTCHQCQGTNYLETAIIPPSWAKGESTNVFTEIWSKAREEINEARNIYIVGYSFPKTDLFFRYFVSLGLINKNSDIRRFRVVNPSSDPEVIRRFATLVGPSVQSKFQYIPEIFEENITKERVSRYYDTFSKEVVS